MTFKNGDRVVITAEGRDVVGRVLIASSNGASLMLLFDAIISGHVGTMPVLHAMDDRYVSIMDGCEIRLKRVEKTDLH